MIKAKLGGTGFMISRVAFGGIICSNEEQADADRYVSFAVDRGVNYFDVAPSYGDAEEKLGPALHTYRQNVYLACKTTERTAAGAQAELEHSLKTLRSDYFDVYQLHALSTKEELEQAFAAGGAMEYLLSAQSRGLIRHIGITSHDEDTALAALKLYKFATVMFPLNWALGLGKGMGLKLADTCVQSQTGLLGMKTLAHRKWRDGEERVYPKSWCKIVYDDERLGVCAIKYTLSQHAAAVVPPGNFDSFAFAADHIDECVSAPFGPEDAEYLKKCLPKDEEHFF